MKAFLCLLLLLMACRQPEFQSKFPDAPTISFCELLKNQNDLQNKTIRVQATYRSGFEMSALGMKGCEDAAWVEFDPSAEENSSPYAVKKFKNIKDKHNGIGVIFVGYLLPPHKPFEFKGKKLHLGFGHMNAYDFEFHVTAIESVK